MNDLYTLTRKLVARGCPEHERVESIAIARLRGIDEWRASGCVEPWETYSTTPVETGRRYWSLGDCDGEPYVIEDSDARDLWTMHALEWFKTAVLVQTGTVAQKNMSVAALLLGDTMAALLLDALFGDAGLLEAIEAATRHLEPVKS